MGNRFRVAVALATIAAASPALAQAGKLIAAEPMAETPAGVQAWKIRYLTTDTRGRPREATGIVMAPREAVPAAKRNVIAWTHGAWGSAEKCAPSLSPNFFNATAATVAVRQGYVVVAPDYIGLGSPGPHPFLVGPATARAVLDSVRAAGGIPGAAAGKRFAVWGESQGGHAALWTGQLASSAGAGLELVGVAAAAPPTDLGANLRQASDANARTFLMALALDSWSKVYGIPLQVGARRTPGIIQRFAGNCVVIGSKPKLGAILGMLAMRQDLKRTDLATLSPWSNYIRSNSPTPSSRVPVMFAQTATDPIVSSAVTRAFAQKMCASRVRVSYLGLPGGDHASSAKQSATQTIAWIRDRFAGRPAPNQCGRF
ncbi:MULTISPECIES: alpha/beta fold hydrolase [Sphingomonas]|uniref:alpha/beta fold hydrolase n=1 Tax=Sphingomonas TaxID=13687 RepID=UPI000DEEE2D8|nr:MULTISPECIES: alpha/beta fold hydrolase [Sphingomonas]